MKRRKIGRYRWHIEFVGRDVWVGVFWKTVFAAPNEIIYRITTVYICIVPCLPIVIECHS